MPSVKSAQDLFTHGVVAVGVVPALQKSLYLPQIVSVAP